MAKNYIIVGAMCFVLGAVCAGLGFWRGTAGEIAELNQRYDQLTREYQDRQRELENNVGQCLGIIDTARDIAERTGENAGGAITNLREASDLIKQGIAQREAFKVELDNLRAGLHRVRDMAGLGDQ